ncbi:hypothetical protein ACIRJS_27290 [Streptomyces sp. NPDC102340]|uniref:hypothetical protein n=1 Tax=unclassified Streptomyces TaxID=2593676 RepID=UPI003830AD22
MGEFDHEAAIAHTTDVLQHLGVSARAGNLANAAAVGITQLVWRNGPVEDAHAGARGRRNHLHDGVMFARNTWIYHQALQAVTIPAPYALLNFEDLLLDRHLVWPGTSRTLRQFGYGVLGEIDKHTKRMINILMGFQRRFTNEEFLTLAALHALQGAEDHFGMPAWEPRAQAAVTRLRGQDQAFIERLKTRYDLDFDVWLDKAPPVVRTDLPEVERALLTAPYELGADTLNWFAWNPVLTYQHP